MNRGIIIIETLIILNSGEIFAVLSGLKGKLIEGESKPVDGEPIKGESKSVDGEPIKGESKFTFNVQWQKKEVVYRMNVFKTTRNRNLYNYDCTIEKKNIEEP